MPKKSLSQIDKQVDKMQDKIEKKEIQEEYKTDVPVFIWFLKFLIVIDIIYLLFRIFSNYDIIINLISIALLLIFLFTLFKRKRWGWCYGLVLFIIGGIASILFNPFATLLCLPSIFLLYIHKDYLNR